MTELRTAHLASEVTPMLAWDFEQLPLVLLTVGDGLREFEALYDHLEAMSKDPAPMQQSLIVARAEMPDMLYTVLRARTAEMPHVHIRRLGDDPSDCAELRHETGTFYVTRKRSRVGNVK